MMITDYIWKTVFSTQTEFDDVRVPVFDLNPNECAKYARLCAAVMFGKWYEQGHAWDRRYKAEIVEEDLVGRGLSIDDVAASLEPGMIIGIINPGTSELGKDAANKLRRYSHNACVIGKDSFGRVLLAEQVRNETRVVTASLYRKIAFFPQEVMAPTGVMPYDEKEIKRLITSYGSDAK